MDSKTRNTPLFVLSIAMALCMASFSTEMWLMSKYLEMQPKQPHPEAGFVRPLSNHEAYVYLSDMQCTGLRLLDFLFIVGFIPAFLIVVKLRSDKDFCRPSLRAFLTIATGFLFWSIIFAFAGPSVVRIAVSNGIIFPSAN